MRLGRYEVVKHLASGTMADLLLARVTGLEGFERHVVIKRIRADSEQDPAFVAMFLEEARLAAVLHHQNIVQVIDIGEVDGKPYFAMEYVHGQDLRHLLARVCQRGEQVPLQHVIRIVAAAATALHHAHVQKGSDGKPLDIVHRDVTPANVLVGFDGNIKVVDFGIARAAHRRSETQAGMLRGKAPYMAPEQCTRGIIDRRSDVFALGVVLYELATVRRLFKGDNEFHTMAAVVSGIVPPPSSLRPNLPPQFDQIVLRALARDPAARYPSAEALFTALDELAVKAGLRTSATALASYLKLQLGAPAEPWRSDAPALAEVGVDWDGARPGVVVPPGGSGPKLASGEPEATPPARPVRPVAVGDAVRIPAARQDATAARVLPSVVAVPVAPAPAPPGRARPKTIQIPVGKVPDARPLTPVVTSVDGESTDVVAVEALGAAAPDTAAAPGPSTAPTERAGGVAPPAPAPDLASATDESTSITEPPSIEVDEATSLGSAPEAPPIEGGENTSSLLDVVEVSEPTNLGSAPSPAKVAPPMVIAASKPRKPGAHDTSLVKPLPPPASVVVRTADSAAEPPSDVVPRRRRWPAVAVAVGTVAVVAGIAIVVAMTGGESPGAPTSAAASTAKVAEDGAAAEPSPTLPEPPAPPSPTEPASGSATALTETAVAVVSPADAGVPAKTAPSPVAPPARERPVVRPRPPAQPAVTKVVPKPVVRPGTPVARPRPTRPKPATPPPAKGWDPNALFPKKK